jgi:hypothetical protein
MYEEVMGMECVEPEKGVLLVRDEEGRAVAVAPESPSPVVAQNFQPIQVSEILKSKTVTNPAPVTPPPKPLSLISSVPHPG